MKIKPVYILGAVIAMLMTPLTASAQQKEDHKPDQIRFGLGGYPLMESIRFTGIGAYPGYYYRGPDLNRIYGDYKMPAYSTGVMNVETSWFLKKWFTFTLTTSASLSWQNFKDSMTDKRIGTDLAVDFYVIPQARFNWIGRDHLANLYTTIGLGAMIGTDFNDMTVIPAVQFTPIGIEIGRNVFGFCEFGIGMLYVGGQAGVGIRF